MDARAAAESLDEVLARLDERVDAAKPEPKFRHAPKARFAYWAERRAMASSQAAFLAWAEVL